MRTLKIVLALPAMAAACGFGFDAWFDGQLELRGDVPLVCSAAVRAVECPPAYNQIGRDNKRVYDMARKMTQGLGAETKFMFWLGLTCNGKDYVWPDGSIAEYTNFNGEPHQGPWPCIPENANKEFFFMTDDYVWNASGNTIFGIEWIVAYSAELGCKMVGTHLASIHGKNNDNDCRVYQSNSIRITFDHSVKHNRPVKYGKSSFQMNDFMRRTAVANGYTNGMHIGMAQLDYMNYSWTDKSPVDYTNYGDNEPDDSKGGCVKMTTDTVTAPWVSEQCVSGNLPYFCTKKTITITDAPQPAGCPANAQYKAGDHIYSPSFPSPGGAALCNYRIGEADIEKKVQLDIVFFESNQLHGYMGPTALQVKATGNTMTLKWNATSGVGVRGFQAIAGNY
ncbi:hypothetical protein PRIPAC_92257 [Pristionchus pacificus]|uniref:C-type lectin n=1 Tax=Pristionchus pacificus TaxID=54126 RepID=A0A2A6BNY1_PRIPA|nr:hypothetical protein PRIPAC_92257 [Pristionchus pacificus]|eukprot:PDM67630.1 C-type lectin [Pristionchus pacificus]